MAVQSGASETAEAAGPYDRAKALGAFKFGDFTFYWITRISAISVLLILGGIIVSLIIGALPAIRAFGLSFLTTARWAPSLDPPVLGALGPLYGTLVTSAIAMVIAIPVGLGIAIFLTELCPQWLRRPIAMAVELLAGIPSIIYGMWGFFVLGPFLANYVQPLVIGSFANVPILNVIFAGPLSIVTHNMQQAARLSDKTAFMYLGELIEFDDTSKIFISPSDRRTQDYITGRFG